jgi:outer membrane protein insertion porin family
MIKKFLITLILIISCSYAKAEVINKIEITGNTRISDETVKIYGGVEANKDYSEKDLNTILNNLNETNFFEDIKINISNNTLFIKLEEYPVVNQLIVIGEKSQKFKKQIIKIIETKEKKSFIKSNLSKDVERIKKLYSSIGHNGSKIETKTKLIDNKNLDLIIEIDRGAQSIISEIVFIGDKKIKDRRLRDVIASEEHKFWKVISSNTNFREELVNLDVRLLTNYYKSIGYYDVNVTSNLAELTGDGNVKLIYSIDAGQRYAIDKISVSVDPVFDKSIFYSLNEVFEKEIGSFYSPFIVKDLLEQIDELIAKNNLQFVEHSVSENINNDLIEIKFNIFESEKILVERINITGNNVTNEDVIRGELIIDEGDPFTKLDLTKSISKLKARNIFGNVNYEVENGSQNNLKIININVEEKPTGEIAAGAGVGTNGGSFAFNISENNWLGEGKKLNFEIDVDQESLRGVVSYSDPNYNFLGNSINYYLSSQSNDKPNQGFENSVIATGASTSFEQYKDLFTSLGISASFDELRTTGSASDSLKKQAGDFSEISGNYGFKYDRRNRAFMPSKGYVVGFNQSLPIYADKQYIANTFNLSTYKSLSDDLIGAGKILISAVNGIGDDDVRISKRKFLSSKRLRGFEKGKVGPVDGKDHIGGNYAAVVNLEANLPNIFPESSNTELGFFMDVGNIWGVDYDTTIDDSDKIRSSAGAAINWLSPLGPMSFIFSTNLSKASTDETESFNFNLGTTF